jgi:hypothetical protein
VLYVGRRGETVRHELRHSRKFAYPRKSFVWFSIVGDILVSLDHLVGELLELPWDFEPKGLRGFEIDD